jgi:subtilase family serine protease
MPIYEQVALKVDTAVNSEIITVQKLKSITPPGFNSQKQLNSAKNYLSEKNYGKICEQITKSRNLIIIGFGVWVASIIIIVVSIIVFVIFRRKKMEFEREKALDRVRERLESSSEKSSEEQT